MRQNLVWGEHRNLEVLENGARNSEELKRIKERCCKRSFPAQRRFCEQNPELMELLSEMSQDGGEMWMITSLIETYNLIKELEKEPDKIVRYYQ